LNNLINGTNNKIAGNKNIIFGKYNKIQGNNNWLFISEFKQKMIIMDNLILN
jgi:hypothetical protein